MPKVVLREPDCAGLVSGGHKGGLRLPEEAPYHGSMRILRLGPGDEHIVVAGGELFDAPPTAAWTVEFLSSAGHHLLVAVDDVDPIGFVSGVETTHPDKGTEMFLYELSVHPDHRNRGVGTALVEALADLARERRCYGMWVGTEPDNAAALATYRAAGAAPPEPSVTLSWAFDPAPREPTRGLSGSEWGPDARPASEPPGARPEPT